MDPQEGADAARADAEDTAVDSTAPGGDQQEQQDEDRDAQGETEEEEDECRVCRETGSPQHPLYKPCKCSGSIGLVHQDCLTSWLEVTRGDGRCELCKTKIRFLPLYATNAPERLPLSEVLIGLSNQIASKWLPFLLRIATAASLWFIVAPLVTGYLYHAWMHKPSSIIARLQWNLLAKDTAGGAVVAVVVVVSCLSLMSFADFLRIQWQQPGWQERHNENDGFVQVQDNDLNQHNDNDEADADADANNEHRVDQAILDHVRLIREEIAWNAHGEPRPQANDPAVHPNEATAENNIHDQGTVVVADDTSDSNSRAERHEGADNDDAHDSDEDMDSAAEHFEHFLLDEMDDQSDDDSVGHQQQQEGPNLFPRQVDDLFHDNNNNVMPQQPAAGDPDLVDPILQDDQVDMEINIALDELVGLRGPINVLVRNLTWLLAFNATYLAVFMFVPASIGRVVYSNFLKPTLIPNNTTRPIPFLYSNDNSTTTIGSVLAAIQEENVKLKTIFRLSDIAVVILGYLSVAIAIVMLQCCWNMPKYFRRTKADHSGNVGDTRTNPVADYDRQHVIHHHGQDDEIDPLHQQDPDNANPGDHRAQRDIHGDHDELNLNDAGNDPLANDHDGIGTFLDAASSVVKVGTLLAMKMFVLPMMLGLCLDKCTMPLLHRDLESFTEFAGRDLFSFILLHWVAGITFMLLVTVFLLQLREVMHPDLLARLIRPQEPQPDLLGNLMNERVATHIRRIATSLAIYVPLVVLLVGVPIKLVTLSGMLRDSSFFRFNFWHFVMPEIQIPIELVVFHLSMLALLERYKNSMGDLQHLWLKRVCGHLEIADHILPKSVKGFRLLGTKPIFLPGEQSNAGESMAVEPRVDPIWYELAEKHKTIKTAELDRLVLSNIQAATGDDTTFCIGDTDSDGNRMLDKSVVFILLPKKTKENNDSSDSGEGSHKLPTAIGRYRLKRHSSHDGIVQIAIWREELGVEIPRPPEGWDDLGAGGAHVQGRWAYGKERKSTIECGVAQRARFRNIGQKYMPWKYVMHITILAVSSWIVVCTFVAVMLSCPLAIGRMMYQLFRFQPQYIHDPFAFVVGSSIFFPCLQMLNGAVIAEASFDKSLRDRMNAWVAKSNLPPAGKLIVAAECALLWLLIAPLVFGVLYELVFVRSSQQYVNSGMSFSVTSLGMAWMSGLAMLHMWAFLMYYRVFTWRFWTRLGNHLLEVPVDDDQPRGNAAGGNDNVTSHKQWQGRNGRIARYFRCWKAVVLGWEWDAVDSISTMDEFAVPVTTQIVVCLVGSMCTYLIISYALALVFPIKGGSMLVPNIGMVNVGFVRAAVFRASVLLHVAVQSGMAFQDRIHVWFEAAHKAARDDRYLIGEKLMNYDPDGNQPSSQPQR